jgi:membrane associated rhomboid family serine protease
MFLLSVLLQVTGCGLPFLMVIHVLASTFFLNFFSWSASVSGLFLGVIAIANYARFNRGR